MEGPCPLHEEFARRIEGRLKGLDDAQKGLWAEVNAMKKWALGLMTALLIGLLINGYLARPDVDSLARAIAAQMQIPQGIRR